MRICIISRLISHNNIMADSFFQKKLFGKLNVMDVLLIALILVVLLGVGAKMFASWQSARAKQFPATLTFTAANVPGYVASRLTPEADCGDLTNNVGFGKLLSVQKTEQPNGAFSVVLKAGEVKASAENNGIKISGTEYLIGQQTMLYTGDVTLTASLSDINKP